jgi:hypothetical protein
MSTTKNLNSMMILLLILCSYATSLRIATKNTGMEHLSYANQCMSGLSEAMPPGFCWKKGADAGVIPTGCPAGYFRSLALCYQYCSPGYTHILGICYKDCDSGYTNHGLSCFRNLFSWYFKHSYIPRSITNFSDEVPCPGNMYRAGALCYRDCRLIGMENCGIGACIAPEGNCSVQILQMVGQVFEGVATGVTTVLSLGASAPSKMTAKAAIKTAVKKLGKDALKAATLALKNALKGKFKDIVLKNARKKVLDLVKDTIKDKAKEAVLMTVCQKVWESVANKEISTLSAEDLGGKVLDTVDILGVKGMVSSCSNITDGGLSCAKSVVEGISTFDPTGILTIAAAFMHPECDVPVNKPADEPIASYEADTSAQARKVQETAAPLKNPSDTVPANCIWAYDSTNFKGNKLEICKTLDFVGDKFNDKIASFVVGKDVQGYFFENARYEGTYLKFSKGTIVDDVKKFTFGNVNLDKLISSVWLGGEDIVSIYGKDKSIKNYTFTSPNSLKVYFNTKATQSLTNVLSLYLVNGKKAVCTFINGTSDRKEVTFDKSTAFPSSSWPKSRVEFCKLI